VERPRLLGLFRDYFAQHAVEAVLFPTTPPPAWAGKLVVSTRKADGWARNVVLDTRENDDDSISVRGQLLRIGTSTEWPLTAEASQIRDGDMARTPLTDRTGSLGNLRGAYESRCGPEPDPTCATSPYAGYPRQFSFGASAKFTAHLGTTTDFISITEPGIEPTTSGRWIPWARSFHSGTMSGTTRRK